MALLCLSQIQSPTELLGQEPVAKKSDLKVLFVGRDPEKKTNVPSYFSGVAAERLAELKSERMAAFESLLNKHFEKVKYIVSEDYQVAMSDEVDVTVFDEVPPPIEVVDMGNWKKRLRLPMDFDRPAVLIELGPGMLGRNGMGLRMDHL